VCATSSRSLEITQSKASRHLRYLSNARLVDDRRKGVWMHYRLADEMGPERRVILDAIRASMSETSLEELREKLAASPGATPTSQGGCCAPTRSTAGRETGHRVGAAPLQNEPRPHASP